MKRLKTPFKRGFISLFLMALLAQCSDKELQLLPEQTKNNISTTKDCMLKKAVHSQTFSYELNYNARQQLTEIEGFEDFDLIEYKGDLPVKAINSLDKSYHIDFGYDAQNNLNAFTFYGKDAMSLPFDFKSKVYTNTKKQIYKVDLALPVFREIVVINIEYDAKGNIKKITKTEKAKTSTVLENLQFDDKKSPYLKASLSHVMMYFVLYTAVLGGENNTFFINQNNPISATVFNNLQEEINFSYKYSYNADNYPTSAEVSRKQKQANQVKTVSYKDLFDYNCK